MSKVKYRSFHKSEETLWKSEEDKCEAKKPIDWSNTPEGYYYIRGDKQGYYKGYIHIGNKWYLVQNQEGENGQWICSCAEFGFFPSLPEKEWTAMSQIPIKRLSKTWRRYLLAHKHWLELRKIGRDIHLAFLKYQKDIYR